MGVFATAYSYLVEPPSSRIVASRRRETSPRDAAISACRVSRNRGADEVVTKAGQTLHSSGWVVFRARATEVAANRRDNTASVITASVGASNDNHTTPWRGAENQAEPDSIYDVFSGLQHDRT